jgi:hypothetical protein
VDFTNLHFSHHHLRGNITCEYLSLRYMYISLSFYVMRFSLPFFLCICISLSLSLSLFFYIYVYMYTYMCVLRYTKAQKFHHKLPTKKWNLTNTYRHNS